MSCFDTFSHSYGQNQQNQSMFIVDMLTLFFDLTFVFLLVCVRDFVRCALFQQACSCFFCKHNDLKTFLGCIVGCDTRSCVDPCSCRMCFKIYQSDRIEDEQIPFESES